MKLVIVGGVAGGASCAARAKRLSEDSQIIVLEKGPHMSLATCGLPYWIGEVIGEEESLKVASPELFKNQFNIDIRVNSEVLSIDRASREVEVRSDGKTYRESYDALVLSPGAVPVVPSIPGAQEPGVFTLRSIADAQTIKDWIGRKKASRAVLAGAGFIGLEMAENLATLGLQVTMLELGSQVLPPFDAEMVSDWPSYLKTKKVAVFLNEGIASITSSKGRLKVQSTASRTLDADLVILSVGVKPDVSLAEKAGLEVGKGIKVDEYLRTSDPAIWAVGDAIESKDFVTGLSLTLPLAGPANRQGRLVADNLFGQKREFRGVQGTAVCKVFEAVAAVTGSNEKGLLKNGMPYGKAYVHSAHHARYYPGAKALHLKILYCPKTGRVLGAQATGEEGVEKRVDVISMAIQKGGTVYDLEDAELCYAPQFGSAKDPVNFAGMIAANDLRGESLLAHWSAHRPDDFLLDVRTPSEYEAGHVDGAVHIPLDQLRSKMGTLPKDRPIYVYCGVGQRAHYAVRLLKQKGYDARNLSGGIQTYRASCLVSSGS